MMTRRDFCKWLAALAVGPNASPEQLAACEKAHDANAPHSEHDLISITDFMISFGGTPRDVAYRVSLHKDGDERFWLASINHRATLAMHVEPRAPMLTTMQGLAFCCETEELGGSPAALIGGVRYFDMDGKLLHKDWSHIRRF